MFQSGIAHSYGTLECQSDKLLALRKQYKNEGINVSVNDLIIKAVSVALTKCPEMNCVWQGDQVSNSYILLYSLYLLLVAGELITFLFFCSKFVQDVTKFLICKYDYMFVILYVNPMLTGKWCVPFGNA